MLLCTLFLVASSTVLDQISGHLTIDLDSYCRDTLLVMADNYLLCTHVATNSTEIFANNRHGFEFHQLIRHSARPNQLKKGRDDSNIYLLCSDGLRKIQQQEDGQFQEHPLIDLQSYHSDFFVTQDERLVGVGRHGQIELFAKSGDGYQQQQLISFSGNLYGLKLSADEREMVSCAAELKIYRHDGVEFELSQTLDIGFGCFEVNFMGGLLEVHGFSPWMEFFEFDGSQYVPRLTLETDESMIPEISVLADGQRFLLGGQTQKILAYDFQNETYSLTEEYDAGVDIYELYVPENQHYFLIATNAPRTLEILFRCP